MGVSSVLKVVVFSLLSFSNHVNAQATMNFMPSGEIYLHFNEKDYLFENINSLSENINGIMDGSFIVDGIHYDNSHNNQIVFQGVHNVNDLQTLVLRGNENIVLNCNNGVFTFYNIILDNNIGFELKNSEDGICVIKGLNVINGNYIQGGVMRIEDFYENIHEHLV